AGGRPYIGDDRSQGRGVLRQCGCGHHREAAVPTVQLLGVPLERGWWHGPRADGRAVDLRRTVGADSPDPGGGSPERHALLGWQDSGQTTVADFRLRTLDVTAADSAGQ